MTHSYTEQSTLALRCDWGFETVKDKTSHFKQFDFDRAVHVRTAIVSSFGYWIPFVHDLGPAIGHHSKTLTL